MLKVNFQLFADVAGLEGIDESIQKQILAEAEAAADADSDKKQDAEETVKTAEEEAKDVEKSKEPENNEAKEQTEENEEEKPHSESVPYARFKDVNTKRKAAEKENEELKRQIEELRKNSRKITSKPVPVVQVEGYNQEQMEKITAYAINKVKEKNKLSDEDVEAIKFGDDATKSIAFDNAVRQETENAIKELNEHRKSVEALNRQWEDTAKEFGELNDKLMSYEDKEARFKFITEVAFEKLPQRKQQILNDAFIRLQNKKGTYADMELINDYFDKKNAEWEKEHVNAASAAEKIEKAQGLPKATSVGGGADKGGMTIEEIQTSVQTADGWSKLPDHIKKQILNGELKM